MTVDSAEHDIEFIQYELNTFLPNGNLSGWREWKISTQFRMGIEICHSKPCVYLPLLPTWWWPLGPKHVDSNKLIAMSSWICCRSCYLKHCGMNRLKVMHADTSEDLGSHCFFVHGFSQPLFAPVFIYEGRSESKERFAIQRYLLIIGKKQNMQVLSHTFTYFST